MWHFPKFLDRFSTVATLLSFVGVPTLSALIAGLSSYWTSLHQGGALGVFLIFLVVFVSCLWSGIGLVWLWDHGRAGGRKPPDCAWGLVPDSYFIAFDPSGPRFCQVSINFRNTLSWPLRVEIEEQFLEIDNRTPDQAMNSDVKQFILLPNLPLALNLASYSKGILPDKKLMKAKLNFVCHYGHPDTGHTRTMKRWIVFEITLPQVQNVPGMMFQMPMPPVKMPLMAGPDKEDEDHPYRGK